MAPESASVGLKTISLKMKQTVWREKKCAYQTSVASSSSLLEARGYISHYLHVTPESPTELTAVSCIVGVVAARF